VEGQPVKIIRVASVAVAAFAFVGAVRAADLKAPAYNSPPTIDASSWTGFYAGLGVGFRASRTELTTTSVSFAGVPLSLANVIKSQPFHGGAFRLSPIVGFNWHFAPRWVAGVEGDFGFADQTTALAGYPSTPAFGNTLNPLDSLAVKTKWDASLRGRFGILLTPAVLAYATGGPAWQHYKVTSTCGSPVCEVTPGANGFTPAIITNSITKTGWTIGGGFEIALQEHWLARAEYRYADFGAPSFVIARSSIRPSFNPSVDTFDVRMRTHAATFGLAYKFN
jgi:outer membrane immunogenic protein